jgi:formyl-CoA transferase
LNFDLRWQHRDALYAIIRAAFLKKPVAEWVTILQGERLLADRVNTPLDWLANEHVVAYGAAARIPQPQLGAVPLPMLPGLGHFVAEAPALGQHTNEVLAELR